MEYATVSGTRRPRIRSIKPEFFSDEKINLIPVGARFTALGLMSMADDRGRIKLMIREVHAYVFPNDGDVSEAAFRKALRQVIDDARFAWEYAEGQFSYLWLPRFWKHQVINKPTESTLPAHPEDPYRHLLIRDALREFRADQEAGRDPLTDPPNGSSFRDSSGSNQVGVRPPRAGARFRSDPDPVVAHLSEQLAGRVRANDPKAHPDPHSERWLSDMRLLLEDREGDVEEVARIIDWCQTDSFWRSNILSPGKLRKQFTTLLLRSQESNVSPISAARRPSAGDLIDEIRASQSAQAGSAA